jgi:hypothetical protein
VLEGIHGEERSWKEYMAKNGAGRNKWRRTVLEGIHGEEWCWKEYMVKNGAGRNTRRRRTVLEEAKRVKKTGMEIKTDAKNRVRWGIPVEAPCSAAE